MTLHNLIASLEGQLEVLDRRGDLGVEIVHITDDSRRIQAGSLFVALKGGQVDGHEFIAKAVTGGAAGLIVQRDLAACAPAASPAGGAQGVPAVRVADTRRALGLLAGRLYGDPSARLTMIGVTGTNGKTTVTYLCRGILQAAGKQVGLIGTVAYLIGAERLPAAHTTPEAAEFQLLLKKMVDANMDAVVMEVSSHALALDRTIGCEFDVAVYTNLTQDHLDFHADMDEYFQTKLRLFTQLGALGSKRSPKRAIVNLDDPQGDRVRDACSVPVWTYAIRSPSDIRAEQVELRLDGTRFVAATPKGRFEVTSRLVGEHNVYNLLAAIGVGLHQGLSPEAIQRGIQAVPNIPGRFERVEAGQDFTVVVDYAHTEDALVRLLAAAQTLKTGRIITVVGCGGDRDRGKRPKMGRAAAVGSDVVFLTADNPRSEDPRAILQEVEAGVRDAVGRKETAQGFRYEVLPDRRRAIEAAVQEAKTGDIVLIAGKGHEDYQIVGTQRLHFDDREVARAALKLVRS